MTQNNISTRFFIILIYFIQTCVHHMNATYHLSHYLVNILVFHISFTDKDLVKTLAWVSICCSVSQSHFVFIVKKTTTLGKLIVQPRTYQLTLTTSPDCVCVWSYTEHSTVWAVVQLQKLNTWTNANSGWGPFKQTTITNGTRFSMEDAHWSHLFV